MNLSDFHLPDLIVKIVAAIVILIVTAIVAAVVKSLLSKLLRKVPALNRQSGSGGSTLADTLGTIGSFVVWILGLMAVLNLFALTGVLAPLQTMLNDLLAALPKVIGAGLILFVGIVLARIVRDLIITALQAAKVDRWANKLTGNASTAQQTKPAKQAKAEQAGNGATVVESPEQARSAQGDAQRQQGGFQISTVLGQLAFALIVIVVAIAALQMLGIKSISDPATHMLQMVLDAIPLLIGAAILLAIGVVIAKFVGDLVRSLLQGLNVDDAFAKLGVDTSKADIAVIISRIVQVAIVLFFAVAAANMLGFPQITNMLNTILSLGGKVIFGAVLIAAGVFIANLVAGFLSGKVAQVVKIATIVLFAAIGLKYMGLADSIVNLAFGAVVVGAAAAAALAFGLGGRDAAAKQLNKMQRDANAADTTAKSDS